MNHFINKKVAIYIRVSTLHQLDKDSLPVQRRELINYCQLVLNIEDYEIYEDAGYSAKNIFRPDYQKMMALVRQGVYSHILVWKIDRISRNIIDFSSMYKELQELGVTFVSKNEQFDTSNAIGEAMLKIILVFAELERNMTSERVKAVMIARAGMGQWNGGRVPFGYDYNSDLQEFSYNADEYNIARIVHDKYEELRSLVHLSHYLNGIGSHTRAGGDWNPVSLLIILRNVFYCGDYRYNVSKGGNRMIINDESEWVTVKDHHPALVSREQKDRIIAILDGNNRLCKEKKMYTGTKHVHVFAGLLICVNCGKRMGSSPAAAKKDWRYSKYSCYTNRRTKNECTGKSTSDPVVGEFLFNYVLNMLNAQNDFSNIKSPEELGKRLLLGDTFKDVGRLESEGLKDLYVMLSSNVLKGHVFGKSAKVSKIKVESELARLKAERLKQERALERLTSLYLFSEDAMSESDFIIQKAKLVDAITSLNEKIGFSESGMQEQSVSDEAFIKRASEFVITQKLTNRNYVSYKALALSVDTGILKTFVNSIIDTIYMDAGRVTNIMFKNGLSQIFVYKDK